MLPNINRGTSFKGIADYLMHDKRDANGDALTSDRVGFCEIVNFVGDEARDPFEAATIMALTVRDRDYIKAAAGIGPGGRKADKPPVWHTSLAWHPDQKPPDHDEMMRAVAGCLKAVGLGLDHGYQTIVVQHVDEPQAHVHIVVNLVHPATGKQANPYRDEPKAQEWGRKYDKARGEIVCHDREAKYAAKDKIIEAFNAAKSGKEVYPSQTEFNDRAQGTGTVPDGVKPSKRPNNNKPRPVYDAEKRARTEAEARSAETIKNANNVRFADMRARHERQYQGRKRDYEQFTVDRKVERDAIFGKYKTALDAVWSPQPGTQTTDPDREMWSRLNERLSHNKTVFEERERTVTGQLLNAVSLSPRKGGLWQIVRLALNGKERRHLFDRSQKRVISKFAPRRPEGQRDGVRVVTPEPKRVQVERLKAMRSVELADHARQAAAALASMKGRHQFQREAEQAEKLAVAREAKAVWASHEREFPGADSIKVKTEKAADRPSPADIDPEKIIQALTTQKSTFTKTDLIRFADQNAPDPQAAREAVAAVMNSPELVSLGDDNRGHARFTARDLQGIERGMIADTAALAHASGHWTTERARESALRGLPFVLDNDQLAAFRHVTGAAGLATVVGFAGSGKSTMLGAARAAWEAQGYQVKGAALQGVTSDNLQNEAGIGSATLHARLYQWDEGKELLTANDVLVVDEAGMIGSRLMGRLTAHVRQAGAKLVLVGDPEQLQAIEAGAAFRAITDRHAPATMTTIRRQRETWQQQATRDLAAGQAATALGSYEKAGMVHGHKTTGAAKTAMVDGWDQARTAQPRQTQIMVAFRREDVRDLNQLARERRQDAGELGRDLAIQTSQGQRHFAAGDRLYFLKNDRKLGVRNGSLGTVDHIDGDRLAVRLDSGKMVEFSTDQYASIDHGYAATIHKSQGVTVDRAHVLATKPMDKHAAYVSLTRHRDSMALHWSGEEYGNRAALSRAFATRRAKDTGLDYDQGDTPPEPAKADRFGRSRDRKPRPPREQNKWTANAAAGAENRPVDAFKDDGTVQDPKFKEATQRPAAGQGEETAPRRPEAGGASNQTDRSARLSHLSRLKAAQTVRERDREDDGYER